MSEHPSDEQIGQYVSRKLPAAELLEIDDHLAVCRACMTTVSRSKQPLINSIQSSLLAEDVLDHLSYEQMTALVDSTMDEVDREIADLHLRECAHCSDEVNTLVQLREALAAEKMSPRQPSPAGAKWYEGIFTTGFLKFAIPAVAVVAIVMIAWNFLRPKDEQPAVAITAIGTPDPAAITSESPIPDVAHVVPPQPANVVTSLNDAGSRVELDEQGNLTGLKTHEFDSEILLALKEHSVRVSPDARNLRGSAGVLMGRPESGVPFKLISPVAKVLETQRPTLKWQPLTGAASYRVAIFDEDFNKVVESGPLKTNSWLPTVPLSRGRIYQWQVTAIRDEQEIKSPARPAPEAKFKVISQSDSDRISRARRAAANSRLVLGIAYAGAGMLDEAEQEFRALARQNPNSQIPRSLLAKIRSSR